MVHFIGMGREVVEARAVQRKPKEERWNKDLVQNLLASPWCNPVPLEDQRVPEVLPPRGEPLPRPVPDGPSAREGPKQVYIRDVDLERYGYTVGCRRCSLMREGQPARGIRHIPACRARIEEAMIEVGDERLQQTRLRQDEEIARRVEEADRRQQAEAAAARPRPAAPGPVAPGTDDLQPPPPGMEAAAPSAGDLRPPPADVADHLAQGDEEEARDQAVDGSDARMHVEEDDPADLMESLLMAPSSRGDGGPRARPSRQVRQEATRVFDLLLIAGVSSGDARATVVELYSPPAGDCSPGAHSAPVPGRRPHLRFKG